MNPVGIHLNGVPRALPGPWALAELIDDLGFTGKRIAVEVNGQIVPRSHYGEIRLAADDRVEVVVAVGGG
ncbi:sulfur carrier protein ThiS [Zoogloea sp.]|uniref:sulfur carrier protein ThiS n=1 Tax=Zoogloea sp. TaxID=49181 RepID=UPI0014165A71|nr:MAG: sulfur carrier protein ThiS [Zoogloea sp.]